MAEMDRSGKRDTDKDSPPAFGSENLRLPDALRGPLKAHMEHLLAQYKEMDWAGEMGFGGKPALVVIDLALWWTRPGTPTMGSDVDSVVEATCRLLAAARAAAIPIFFTTSAYDPAAPPTPHRFKCSASLAPDQVHLLDLDPRLGHRPNEPIVRKHYASVFRATNLLDSLAALGIDTLIVSGVSTSHCVYATCRDAAHTFRVIVPREAVGERCELMHEVNLLDIQIDLGDVMPVDEVVDYLEEIADKQEKNKVEDKGEIL
jgi:maleamate amidohydrolase